MKSLINGLEIPCTVICRGNPKECGNYKHLKIEAIIIVNHSYNYYACQSIAVMELEECQP